MTVWQRGISSEGDENAQGFDGDDVKYHQIVPLE